MSMAKRALESYFPLLSAEADARKARRDAVAELGFDPAGADAEEGLGGKAARAFCWMLGHQGTMSALVVAVVVAMTVVGQMAEPQEAVALPIIPIVVGGALIGAFFAGGSAIDATVGSIDEALRSAVNFELATITASIDNFVNNNLLTQGLDSIMPGVVDVLKSVYHTVAVPAADVVLLVFLVVGLGKVVSNMNKAETGVDLWSLVMVFVGFAFAKTIVDGSWALMELAFNIARWVIVQIANNPAAEMAFAANAVPEDVTNWGILLMMLLVAFLVKLVVLFVIVLANITVIVRCIQIYVYLALAPLPLATLVSDGGRQIAAHFAKAFAAVLLSGAILALLFVMMGAFVSNLAATTVDPSSAEAAVQWVIELFFSIAVFLAFGWCVFQSGSWARDFTGA